jgi:hypothetical protein
MARLFSRIGRAPRGERPFGAAFLVVAGVKRR